MADTAELKDAQRDVSKADGALEQAGAKKKKATEQLSDTVSQFKGLVKEEKEGLEQIEEERAAADAETQAAKAGRYITLAEAYAMVEQDDRAGEKLREAQGKAIGDALGGVGAVLEAGGAVIAEEGDSFFDGAVHVVTDPASRKKAAGSLFLGIGAGALVKNDELRDGLINTYENIVGLKGGKLDDGVDEKSLFASDEEAVRYQASNAGGEGTVPAGEQPGDPDVEPKEPEGGNVNPEQVGHEIGDLSDEQLAAAADMNEIQKKQQEGDIFSDGFGDENLEQLAAQGEAALSGEGTIKELATAVVSKVLPDQVAESLVEGVSTKLSPLMQQLAASKPTDAPEAGNDGPTYPA